MPGGESAMNRSRARWLAVLTSGVIVTAGAPTTAATRCERLVGLLAQQITGATCAESTDLTTNNPATTPPNNSLPGLPAGAFTPQTDRDVISPSNPNHTPIAKSVPGVQLDAGIADDAAGEARILIRLPNDWNGKLVVAGASGTRTSSTAISPGAISSCRRAMPTCRRTKAF
jgi:hypothetical protein